MTVYRNLGERIIVPGRDDESMVVFAAGAATPVKLVESTDPYHRNLCPADAADDELCTVAVTFVSPLLPLPEPGVVNIVPPEVARFAVGEGRSDCAYPDGPVYVDGKVVSYERLIRLV